MAPTYEDLPDPQHVSTTLVDSRGSEEYQAGIQCDNEPIVTVSYEIGNPINIVVMSPNEGEIVATHKTESPIERPLDTRRERSLSIVQETGEISLHGTLLVVVRWRPADGITVTVFDPHSEGYLDTYEFPDPVDPKNQEVNKFCSECGEFQAHQEESDTVCLNCNSTDS